MKSHCDIHTLLLAKLLQALHMCSSNTVVYLIVYLYTGYTHIHVLLFIPKKPFSKFLLGIPVYFITVWSDVVTFSMKRSRRRLSLLSSFSLAFIRSSISDMLRSVCYHWWNTLGHPCVFVCWTNSSHGQGESQLKEAMYIE